MPFFNDEGIAVKRDCRSLETYGALPFAVYGFHHGHPLRISVGRTTRYPDGSVQ